MATTFTTTLTEKLARTPGTMSFRFERPDGYDYRAGQWFVITLPGPGSEEERTHHFTLSSSPTEPHLEFTTRLTGSAWKQSHGGSRDGHRRGGGGSFRRLRVEG